MLKNLTNNSLYFPIIMLLPLVVILLIPNYSYYWDGIDYVWHVENSPYQYLFHKHHLFYTPVCKLLYLVINDLGLKTSALSVMIGINILAGLLYLYLSFLVLKMVFENNKFYICLGYYIIVISYAFFNHFRNVSPYLIPLTIITLIMYRYIKGQLQSRPVGVFDWFLLSLAVLFHQIAMFFIPAMLYAQFVSLKKKKLKCSAIRLCTLMIALAFVYGLTYTIVSPKPSTTGFLIWLKGYASHDFWVFSESTGLYAVFKQSVHESILSHKALFFAPIDRESIRLNDYPYVFGNRVLGQVLSNILLILVITVFGYGILFISHLHANTHIYRRFQVFLLLFISPYFLFLQFFTPYQNFYRLFYLLPVVIILIDGFGKLKFKHKNQIAVVFLLSSMYLNFSFGLLPEGNLKNNEYLNFVYEVKKYATHEDLFIFSVYPDYHYGVYLRYFGVSDVSFIRSFIREDYAAVEDDYIDSVEVSARQYLNERYENILFPADYDLDSLPFLRLSPPITIEPQIIIIRSEYINIGPLIEINDREFNFLIIQENL